MEQCQWRRLNGQLITSSIADAAAAALEKEIAGGNEIKVCIGTDSQVKGRITVFATVIVFLRKGKDGFMFICTESTAQRMSIRERMLAEVSRSIDIAYELCPAFSRYSVAIEVHVDINTNPGFKSNGALKEAMGYITGMGFTCKAKPQAFASSSCADKIVQ